MALIDVTIENPSLVSTGGEGSPTTSSGTEDESEESDPEAEFEEPASDAAAEGTDDDLAETLKTISTLLTAATTVAGVLKKLRSEDESEADSAVDVAEGLFEDEEVGGEDEVDSFEEELVEEDNETETDVDEEGEETDEGDEAAENDSGRGPGLKVAFVLVVLLVALVLWTRGDDEESELDEDWE